MKYRKIVLFLSLLTALFIGCESLITNTGRFAQLAFSFRMADAPPQHSIFHPGEDGHSSLAKSLGLVGDTVLLLHCDADSGQVAKDASNYGNDAQLFNVQRIATPNGNGLVFNGRDSYGVIEHQPALNGTFGLVISCYIFAYNVDSTSGQQALISKSGSDAGYQLGLSDNRVIFRIAKDRGFIQLSSRTIIEPEKWYKVKAGFGNGTVSLSVNDNEEATMKFEAPITPSDRALWIGSSLTGLNAFTAFFNGIIDEIEIKTVTKYLDIDFVRVLVLDLSKFNTIDEFYTSDVYQRYEREYWNVAETARVLSWEDYKRLWSNFFPVVTDQTLQIKGGYAEGLVNAAEGLNKIVVSAVKDGKVVYYGEGHAIANKERMHSAKVVMWPAEHGQP